MPGRGLAILLALLALGLFSTTAFAGVEGSLTFDIWAWPQTTSSEVSTFDFGFEALLEMDLIVSGMMINNRLAMGIAGLEHYIMSLDTSLGPFEFESEFVFAVPFIGCPRYKLASYSYISLFRMYGPFTECRPIGDPLFVKKRVDLSFGEGILLSGLLLLEDANFPSPTQAALTPEQDLNGNGVYEANEQQFRFGYISRMTGTTVQGVQIEAQVGFCADWRVWAPYYYWIVEPVALEEAVNEIKGYRWYVTVCKDDPSLVKEFISLENIELTPDFQLDTYILTTINPFTFDIHIWADYFLPLDLGTLSAWFHLSQGLELAEPVATVVMLDLDGFNLFWHDADGDWTMSSADTVLGLMEFDYQDASFLIEALITPTLGPQALLLAAELPISHPEPIGELKAIARWATPTYAASFGEAVAHEDMIWDAIDLNLTKSFENQISMMIEVQYGAQYAGSGTMADPYRVVGYGLRAIDFQFEVAWFV